MQDDPVRARAKAEADRRIANGEFTTQADVDAFMASAGVRPKETDLRGEAARVTSSKAPDGYAGEYFKGLARNAAQGPTLGQADEIEAGMRAHLPLNADDRGKSYREIRDEVRGSTDQFAHDNPLTAFGANAVGSLVTGAGAMKLASKVPMLARMASAAFPEAGTATFWQKVAGGAKAGTAVGTATGVGMAPEMRDVPDYAWKGAVGGAALGGGLSAGIEGFQGARNAITASGRSGKALGPIRRAIQAEVPQDAGARKVLTALGHSDKTVEQLARESAAADGPDILAEVIGKRGVDDVRTARGLGYQSPAKIEKALTTRARNEVGRVRDAAQAELGEPVDDVAFLASKKAEAQAAAGPLYQQAVDGRTITDRRVIDLLERPGARKAYTDAVELAANDGVEMPTVAQITTSAHVAEAGRTRAAPSSPRAIRSDEDWMHATLPELREMRSSRPLWKMTDRQLDIEHAYLSQMQAKDGAAAVPLQTRSYADYMDMKAGGHAEDARGALEHEVGYDPATFAHTVGRDAGKAKANLPKREPKLAEVAAELEKRSAARGGAAGSEPIGPGPARAAHTLREPDEAPTLPTLDARHVQYWKFGLDARIAKLEGLPGGAASHEYSQLIKQRDAVESLLYEHTEGWGAAQQAYAKPMQEAGAFAEGQRAGRTMRPADVPRLMDGPYAPFRSKGVGNTILEDLGALRDGSAGNVRNPAPTVMGSNEATARLRVATGGDAAKQARIEQVASNAERRLQTRGVVMGGSQTAEKLAAMAEHKADGTGEMIHAATHPWSAVPRMVGKGADALRQRVTGNTMDAMSEYLMAGADGYMSREEAVAILLRMEPALRAQIQKRIMASGATAGAGAQHFGRPAR